MGVKTNLKARAVIKLKEREFQICAAEKPLLVKILFEEVHFKASFEGGEGRAVTAKEREFQIWTAEKQKAQPPFCFLLKKGMQKILSSEEERRDLEGT